MVDYLADWLSQLNELQAMGATFLIGLAAIVVTTGRIDMLMTERLYQVFGSAMFRLLARAEMLFFKTPLLGGSVIVNVFKVGVFVPSIWVVILLFLISFIISGSLVSHQVVLVNAHTELFGNLQSRELFSDVLGAIFRNSDISGFLFSSIFVGYIAVFIAINISRAVPWAFLQVIFFIAVYPLFYIVLSFLFISTWMLFAELTGETSTIIFLLSSSFEDTRSLLEFLISNAFRLPFVPSGEQSDDFLVDIVRGSTFHFHVASSTLLYASIIFAPFLSLLLMRKPIAEAIGRTPYFLLNAHVFLCSLGFHTKPLAYLRLISILIWTVLFGGFVFASLAVEPLVYVGKHRIQVIENLENIRFRGEIEVSKDCDVSGSVWYFGTPEQNDARLGFGEGQVLGSIRNGKIRFTYEPYLYWGTDPIIRDFDGDLVDSGRKISGEIDFNDIDLRVTPAIGICS